MWSWNCCNSFFTSGLPFYQKLKSLFNNSLDQDGLICDKFCWWSALIFDDVGWWSGFNKVGNIIDDLCIGFLNTLEGIITNNKVAPSYVARIGSSIILTDVSSIQ